MYDNLLDELSWYSAMAADPRDCVRVCDCHNREVVPYDTLKSALKCCIRPRNNGQWCSLEHAHVYDANVCMDVRGYMRVTLYID